MAQKTLTDLVAILDVIVGAATEGRPYSCTRESNSGGGKLAITSIAPTM